MSSFPMQFPPPPRRVPLSLGVVNLFNGIAQIGWGIFGFGMIFFWVFVSTADFSFINFRGPFEHAAGRVISVENTGASVNGRSVRAYHYEYSVAGNAFSGTSYTTSQGAESGESVDVEYKADDPTRSRIAGMRRAQFGPALLFVTIFPLAGLAILLPSMLMGLKRSRLLRDGVFTTGTLKAKRATNVEVNDRRVFALTFEFTARDGRRREATAATSLPERLEDDAQEPLLYDPDDPSQAFLLDDAPARPKMEMNGDLIGRPIAALASLILPLIVIAANGLVLFVKLHLH